MPYVAVSPARLCTLHGHHHISVTHAFPLSSASLGHASRTIVRCPHARA